jgi:hypothetical protein
MISRTTPGERRRKSKSRRKRREELPLGSLLTKRVFRSKRWRLALSKSASKKNRQNLEPNSFKSRMRNMKRD